MTARRKTSKPGLPKRPTRSQKDAAAKLGRTKAQQEREWSTTSTFGDRLHETRDAIDHEMRRLFPTVEQAYAYNMHGWKVRRKTTQTQWKGTMDPNWLWVFVAERKQGITIHVWNPFAPMDLKDPALSEAGFKVMVGCLQYNRKGPVPVTAFVPTLQEMAKAWKAER